MIRILAAIVIGAIAVTNAQAQTGSAAARAGAAAGRTGSVVTSGTAVVISTNPERECPSPVCATTVLNGAAVRPPLRYSKATLLGDDKRTQMFVAVCGRGKRPNECPDNGRFSQTYEIASPQDAFARLQDQVNFGALRDVPGCFVLLWNAGTANERVSTPFAIQASSTGAFPCRNH